MINCIVSTIISVALCTFRTIRRRCCLHNRKCDNSLGKIKTIVCKYVSIRRVHTSNVGRVLTLHSCCCCCSYVEHIFLLFFFGINCMHTAANECIIRKERNKNGVNIYLCSVQRELLTLVLHKWESERRNNVYIYVYIYKGYAGFKCVIDFMKWRYNIVPLIEVYLQYLR